MKKNALLIFSFFIVFIISSCSEDNDPIISEVTPPEEEETSDWVLINGVKWATRNVDLPGAFVQNPEDYGGYYQWNRCTTDSLLSGDDYSNSNYPLSTTWLPANDPSPEGYRLPTLVEIERLTDTFYVTSKYATRNGVYGKKFTDKANGKSIFLPAAGYRSSVDGRLYGIGTYGYYSGGLSGGCGNNGVYTIYFVAASDSWNGWINKSNALSVRPVSSDMDSIVFEEEPKPEEDWVLINNVKWATCNVGLPGAFVQNPEDYGGYYQWNRNTADFLPYSDYYGSSYPNSTTWLPANDPSPPGYRVPAFEEIQSLTDTIYVTNEWAVRNGVYGRKFTDKASGKNIFLPAAGYRYYYDGTLNAVGAYGSYWSSMQYGSNSRYAYRLLFDKGLTYWGNWSSKPNGRSIRPVAE